MKADRVIDHTFIDGGCLDRGQTACRMQVPIKQNMAARQAHRRGVAADQCPCLGECNELEITVVLPAYNAERWLREAISSVLCQTHRAFELILIDDGSSDSTGTIMEQAAAVDERVVVIRQPNLGFARSLNRGLRAASHEWVARMDADDIMEPNRLERQILFLSANPDVTVAGSLVNYIGPDGRLIGKSTSPFVDRRSVQRAIAGGDVIAINHPSAIMKRNVIESLGGYRPEFNPMEDLDLWNRAVECGHLILVQPEYLLNYRIHDHSMWSSASWDEMTKIDWLRDCIERRRSGRAERSLQEFIECERNTPRFARLNRYRIRKATQQYRDARTSFAGRRYGHMARCLGASMLLNPGYPVRQVWSKFARRRVQEDW